MIERTGDSLVDVLLREYDALKAEQIQRISTRDNLIYATLLSMAGVAAATLQAGVPALLLTSPRPRTWSRRPSAGRCVASVHKQGAFGGHAYVVVALTNVSTVACRVIGYAQLAAVGSPAARRDATGNGDLVITTIAGGLSTSEDPDRHNVGLGPGQAAYFVVETEIAEAGTARIFTITKLWILLSEAGQPGSIPLPLVLPASAPHDRLLTIRVGAVTGSPTGS